MVVPQFARPTLIDDGCGFPPCTACVQAFREPGVVGRTNAPELDPAQRASLAYYRDAAESARGNHDALERGNLTVPVLGISSSHGSIPDMAASLSPWAKNVTGAVIPQAGHFIPDEQPGATVEVLTAFIDHERVEQFATRWSVR